jgi:hypothetical protein
MSANSKHFTNTECISSGGCRILTVKVVSHWKYCICASVLRQRLACLLHKKWSYENGVEYIDAALLMPFQVLQFQTYWGLTVQAVGGGVRIQLGDNTGVGAFMVRLIRFQDISVSLATERFVQRRPFRA